MKLLLASTIAALGLWLGNGSASAVPFCQAATDRNCFTGKFGLVDIPGDPDHKLLEADFGYIDAKGMGWQTNKATKTDGASIPPLLQPFVGSPWEDGYIRAAVIHDWYCDRHVRTWRETHRVFYDAMLASGLQKPKAKLLFYAVYAFGPRWGYLVPGQPCAAGKNCVQMTGKGAFFIERLYILKNASHILDVEELIIDYLKDVRFVDGNKDLNHFRFADSKSEPGIQISDVVTGFLGKYFSFICATDDDALSEIRHSLGPQQKTNLSLLYELLERSNDENLVFAHAVMSNRDRMMAEAFREPM